MQLTTLVNDDYVKICKIIKVIISRKTIRLVQNVGLCMLKKAFERLVLKYLLSSWFFKELQLN